MEEFGQTKAYRKRITAFGREVLAVITDNPELTRGQLQGVLENCRKCRIKLEEYQEKLAELEEHELGKSVLFTDHDDWKIVQ